MHTTFHSKRIWERLFGRPRSERADNTETNFSDIRCTTVVCVRSAEDRNKKLAFVKFGPPKTRNAGSEIPFS